MKRSRSKSLVRSAKRRRREAEQNLGDGCSNFKSTSSTAAAAPPSGRAFSSAAVDSFEAYYRKQGIVEETEWHEFSAVLRKPLPITFRFNTSKFAAQCVDRAKQEGEQLLCPTDALTDDYGAIIAPPRPLPWVDGWQLSVERSALRRSSSHYLQELRKWLVCCTRNGTITRQELVSMVPAAVLQVEPQHRVLDLCAAPGSKTTQLLELLHSKEPSSGACVVANDSNAVRAYTLSSRCAALGQLCSRLVVTVHPAQRFPDTAGEGQRTVAAPLVAEDSGRSKGFDRVLCDVPCSGDGTLRKNPEVWKRWGPGLAIKHHCIQVQIALRGATLLRTGGLMTYSTCSLSPLENEAVLAEVLRCSAGALELVDVNSTLKGLVSSPGVTNWHVCDDAMTRWFPSYSDSQGGDVPRLVRHAFRPSMWPPTAAEVNAMKLERAIRILPHHQDCGGFFVALLRKTKPLSRPRLSTPIINPTGKSTEGAVRNGTHGLRGTEGGGDRPLHSHLHYKRVDPGTLRSIKEQMGLKDSFLSSFEGEFRHRSSRGSSAARKIWIIPSEVLADVCSTVNTVSAGLLMFLRYGSRSCLSNPPPWELTHHAARLLLPHMNKKRGRLVTVQPQDVEDLKAAGGKPVPVSQLSSGLARSRCEALGPGPCIIALPADRGVSSEAYAAVILSPPSPGSSPSILVRKGSKRPGRQSLLVQHGD